MTHTEEITLAKEIELSTEEKILHSARKVFTKKGLSGARMQDIADEAGINKALLHYYFRSKEKLFEKIFEEASTKMFAKLTEFIDSKELSLFEKIEKMVENQIAMSMENPFLPAFVINEFHQNAEGSICQTIGRKMSVSHKLIEHIQEAVNQGLIRPINPIQLFINIMSLSMFPFVSKPILQINMNVTEEQFALLMEQRKKDVADFVIRAIKL
ncbi:MAG: TetR/AcrR family transcriptional regulator [Cytophagales bacterium]|nr:MAG: TetR/AcrR family transcriptional regulator [Cytophagales bacterium]